MKTFNFDIISSTQKIKNGIIPYLTFPLIKFCGFQCLYCGLGGEMTASYQSIADINFVIEKTLQAYEYGIRKFRFTGGEPTLYERFADLLKFYSKLDDITLLFNSNGAYIKEKKKILYSAKKNVHFAVSFDSLNKKNFDRITGTTKYFHNVLDGIKILSDYGRLLRINMVISKLNVHEVFDMIDFCRGFGVNLKLLDVVSVPIPFNERNNLFIDTDELEAELIKRADHIESHQYAKNFGTPCSIYTINGVQVTVKLVKNGSHFDLDGICKGCPYFPCHEGLYDLLLLPDGRLCGCRWLEKSVSPGNSFVKALDNLVKAFQRAEWYKSCNVESMAQYPEFVRHSIE
jgi:GTP 3',8-cyclase